MDLGISGKSIKGKIKYAQSIPRSKKQDKQDTTSKISTKTRNSSSCSSSSTKSKTTINNAKSTPKLPVAEKPQSLTQQYLKRLNDEKNELCSGNVNIKFNHYNKTFPVHNNILKWCDIDEEYSVSYVYKGEYIREIYYDNDINNISFDNR